MTTRKAATGKQYVALNPRGIPRGVHVLRFVPSKPGEQDMLVYEGDVFTPPPGANIERFLREGFIREAD